MNAILMTIAILFIGFNVYGFIRHRTYEQFGFDGRLFVHLFVAWLITLFGFAFIYYLLSRDEIILVTSLESMTAVAPTWDNLLYFSGVTLLSIGFGDILPLGLTRLFALLESAIGILLPSVFFLKSMYKKED